MKKMKYTILTLSIGILTLSGCKNIEGNWFSNEEVGPKNFNAPLGTAYAQNQAVQTGILSKDLLTNLTRKFASEAPATINFDFNSSRLDTSSRLSLQQQVEWIKKHPQITFTVYGHTDKVGSDAYNRNLGKRRAQNAVNYMLSLGLKRSQIRGVASFGETQPIVLTESANRENRRTVTEVSGFGSFKKDGQLTGEYALKVYDRYINLENLSIIEGNKGGLVSGTADGDS